VGESLDDHEEAEDQGDRGEDPADRGERFAAARTAASDDSEADRG
jgi:hypothetical protein